MGVCTQERDREGERESNVKSPTTGWVPGTSALKRRCLNDVTDTHTRKRLPRNAAREFASCGQLPSLSKITRKYLIFPGENTGGSAGRQAGFFYSVSPKCRGQAGDAGRREAYICPVYKHEYALDLVVCRTVCVCEGASGSSRSLSVARTRLNSHLVALICRVSTRVRMMVRPVATIPPGEEVVGSRAVYCPVVQPVDYHYTDLYRYSSAWAMYQIRGKNGRS